ncbi:unnamed protein product [Cylicostephanus goldi]|uniref:Uncharacterized protein n=1 Tax=Cylicostephanus goldi TaxID=71465 RepID=A0A3P6T0I5_CYLGO|nr:unnamed protein product [Cylicostephanus goldi]
MVIIKLTPGAFSADVIIFVIVLVKSATAAVPDDEPKALHNVIISTPLRNALQTQKPYPVAGQGNWTVAYEYENEPELLGGTFGGGTLKFKGGAVLGGTVEDAAAAVDELLRLGAIATSGNALLDPVFGRRNVGGGFEKSGNPGRAGPGDD